MIQRGQITKLTIVRGPTTKQFWTIARHVPGVAHLLGYCHQCDAPVDLDDHGCHSCGARFVALVDRNYMGLPELRPLPWESQENAAPETSALAASPQASAGATDFDDQSTGGRLSSFATDDELLSPEDVDDQAWGGPELRSTPPDDFADAGATYSQSQSTATAVAEAAEAQQPAASQTNDNLVRLARRRVLRLQAKMQRLWIALGISIALNVVLASVMLFAPNARTDPADSATDASAKSATETSKSNASTDAHDDTSADNADAVEQSPIDVVTPEVTEQDENQPVDNDASAPAAPSPYEKLLSEAHELINAAKDDTRELSDRIADYEQAITRLEDVRINAPLSVRPADIAEQVDQAERELERLRLREFFP